MSALSAEWWVLLVVLAWIYGCWWTYRLGLYRGHLRAYDRFNVWCQEIVNDVVRK